MGLIKAAAGAAGGTLADQWKEYFYCDSLTGGVLAVKGQKRTSKRSSNTKGNENIITSGSVIAVADGQCMLVVEQGKVVEVCAEPGEFTFDASTEPSILAGGLNGANLKSVFATIGKRFTFGGEAPKDQRVYYINTKEIVGNKYGTAAPVPFKVVDDNIGFTTNIGVKCFGEFSYRIANPISFYTTLCGNMQEKFERESIDGQLKTELLTALQPAFAKLGRVDYTELPAHTVELSDAINDVLTEKWLGQRGIEVVSFGISSIKASEEDEKRLQQMQERAFIGGGNVMMGTMAAATANAMETAAGNPNGAMMGFMGMGMAQGMGMGNMQGMANMQGMYGGMQQPQQPMQQPQQPMQQAPMQQAAPAGWTCECGAVNQGNFCSNCGKPKPV